MFIHKETDFHKNKVLKADVLQESIDYGKEMLQHIYKNYSDGIISGAEISVNNGFLTVHPGIIKHGGILYHMSEKQEIPYEHSEKTMFLKIRFLEESQYENGIQYTSEFVLTDIEEVFPYEMELGRFVAEKGATLHMDYTNLESLKTRYNQFDIRNIPYAGIGESTLAPEITYSFGKILIKKSTQNYYDIAFAMQCLNKKPIERSMIYEYLTARMGADVEELTNEEICDKFLEILQEAGTEKRIRNTKSDRRIIVD